MRNAIAGSGLLALIASGMIGGAVVAAGSRHQVIIKAVSFAPLEVMAHVGDVVEWDNQDIVAHTATSADKAWEVVMKPGQNAQIVVRSPGTFDYICRYHPNMKGKLVVER